MPVAFRHVAVGWGVIETALEQEKVRRNGNVSKRVKRVLARSKRDHVPGAPDLDGVAVGIVRLHDYYKVRDQSRCVCEGGGDLDPVNVFKSSSCSSTRLPLWKRACLRPPTSGWRRPER